MIIRALFQQIWNLAKEVPYLTISLVFLLLALSAALFGFEILSSEPTIAAVAKIAFWIFLVIFQISLVIGLVRRPAVY